MSLSRIHPILIFFFLAVSGIFSLTLAHAAEENPIHWSAQKTKCDRKANRCELHGSAALHQSGESLYADNVYIDLETKLVSAYGNVNYVSSNALIQADEMHFNLETRTGSIIRGRVSTNQITLTGERINKLGPDRFQTHRGEYTTCKDCPRSWSLLANDVDLEIEGYAFMSSVTMKIGDAPSFWIPYMIVPIKTKRQTGLLIPRFGFTAFGTNFVQPFFWAINRSMDATIGYGVFGGRGNRLEAEGRYNLGSGDAQINYFSLTDRRFRDSLARGGWLSNEEISSRRFSLFVRQRQSLPFGIEERLRVTNVSDSWYPSLFPNDMTILDPKGELVGSAALPSDLTFLKSNDRWNAYVTMRRYRNLMTLGNDSVPVQDPRVFDNSVVQVLPQGFLNTTSQELFGGIYGSVSLGVARFQRGNGPYDADMYGEEQDKKPRAPNSPYQVGKDPIREATRVTLNPRLSRSFRLFDVMEVQSSAQYLQYLYQFQQFSPEVAPRLSRGYLQTQLDLSTQFERVYDMDNPKYPKMKHLIRPILSYSLIPYRREPNHPFISQLGYAQNNGFTGYQFDNYDIVPLDSNFTNANYFAPQGNSISYGFNSQLIRKQSTPGGTKYATGQYVRSLDWSAGQSFNFREIYKDKPEKRPLSRFYSLMNFNYDDVGGFFDYYYIPYQPIDENKSRHVLTASARYLFESGSSIPLMTYERSFGVAYSHNRSNFGSQNQNVSGKVTYSLNDFVMPQLSASYDMLNSRWLSVDSNLTFQSPSQCWRLFLFHQLRLFCPEKNGCSSYGFQWGINLDGSSFGGLNN